MPEEPRRGEISVVIPCFKASGTIDRALASIAAQTRPAFEVIVVDDASPESEAVAIRQVVERYAFARLVRLDANGGPSVARNRGADLACGEFLAFLDSDDWWFPTKLETCVGFLERTGAYFVGHNNTLAGLERPTVSDRLRPGRRAYRMRRADIFISTSQFAPSTIVFRNAGREVRFDEALRRSEDYQLWGRLVFAGRELWKLKEFLGGRQDLHIKGGGLSADPDKMLTAHRSTVDYFSRNKLISPAEAGALKAFLSLKFARHKLP